MDRLGAACETAVAEAIDTVLYQHTLVRSVAYGLVRIIRPRSFASLHGYSIIVDLHITATDEDVVHHIEVDGIGRRSFVGFRFGKGEDADALQTDVMAVVDMCGPESGVLQTHVLDAYVLAVADIEKPRALLVLVGAFGVPLTAKPESTVIA